MIRFFTWHDIAVAFEKLFPLWPEGWQDVKVYSDSIVIYYNADTAIQESSRSFLKQQFTKNYDQNTNRILIDYSSTYLDIYYEEDDTPKKKRTFSPLFRNIYYMPEQTSPASPELPGARILAFHSYKGGVGRTLSLVSFLRECTALEPQKKILVIDADMEAPGLTWMLEGKYSGEISYLDLLSIMNSEDSAPFLFDSRVEKYYVTSTSLQSIRGTNQILKQIYNYTDANFLNSRILLTMIPDTLDNNRMNEIQSGLLKNVSIPSETENSTYMLDNYIIRFRFEDALVHIEDFESLCNTLRGKRITENMGSLVSDFFPDNSDDNFKFEESQARSILQKLHSIATDEITAEAGSVTNMLATFSLIHEN